MTASPERKAAQRAASAAYRKARLLAGTPAKGGARGPGSNDAHADRQRLTEAGKKLVASWPLPSGTLHRIRGGFLAVASTAEVFPAIADTGFEATPAPPGIYATGRRSGPVIVAAPGEVIPPTAHAEAIIPSELTVFKLTLP